MRFSFKATSAWAKYLRTKLEPGLSVKSYGVGSRVEPSTGHHSKGKLLVLPANIRLLWKWQPYKITMLQFHYDWKKVFRRMLHQIIIFTFLQFEDYALWGLQRPSVNFLHDTEQCTLALMACNNGAQMNMKIQLSPGTRRARSLSLGTLDILGVFEMKN